MCEIRTRFSTFPSIISKHGKIFCLKKMEFPFVKGKICRLDKFKKLPKATPLLFQSDSVEIHFIYCSHPFDDFPTETTTAPTTNMYSCVCESFRQNKSQDIDRWNNARWFGCEMTNYIELCMALPQMKSSLLCREETEWICSNEWWWYDKKRYKQNTMPCDQMRYISLWI